MSKFTKKFGFVFPEVVEIGKRRKNAPGWWQLHQAQEWESGGDLNESGKKPSRTSPWRSAFIYLVFLAATILLAARSFDLQIIQGRVFLGQAEGNRIRLQVDHAPRGVIFDRNGKLLAQNIPGFRLSVEPKSLPNEKRRSVISKLAGILEVTPSSIEDKLKSKENEITLTSDLDPDKALIIEAESKNLPGINLEVSPIRYYPYKEITASILGYTAEADKNDLSRKLAIPYSLGDKVGKDGVEETMEETLRGINGYQLVKVAASGEKKGEIYQSEPKPGGNITLSIDVDLQKFVYDALESEVKEDKANGASAVVLDPSTGEILALVSIPSYDNNVFSNALTSQEYQSLISNPDNLLLNRAIGSAYPPGSTFKMVTAAAGLETGAITADTKFVDPGYITLGSHIFQNWLWIDHHETEGALNVVRAIARSTDTFFYLLGQKIGEGAIAYYAKKFGLGQKTGVELPGETAGLIPTPAWKISAKGEPWYPGDTLNTSIGQGDVLVSPLQLSMVTAAFANGGKLLAPTILKTNSPKIVREDFLKKETIETVREGLYQDTIGDGNVGWLFGSYKIPSAGKTGSAESGQERPHAWYTGYAPYLNPKIVVTVQVEYGGNGSEVSAPVVKDIFNWWFTNRN
jgi:penicillin-binding protein 2